MVEKRLTQLGLLLLLGSLASACGLWGERAPDKKVVQYQTPEVTCPSPKEIILAETSVALQGLDCWNTETQKLWSDVQGKQKNHLSDQEVRLLVQKKVLRLTGRDPDRNLQMLFEIRDFLGMKNGLSRAELENWLQWIRERLPRIQVAYQKFILLKGPFVYSEFDDSAHLAADFLDRLNWNWDAKRLSRWFSFVFERPSDGNAYVQAGMDVIGLICPHPSAPENFAPQEIATCLRTFSEKFRPGARWFNMVLNPIITIPPIQSIRESLDRVAVLVPEWFKQKELKPLHTAVWVELGRTLGHEPPDDLEESLKLIRKFEPGSSPEFLQPALVSKAFEVLYEEQKIVLEGMPHYQEIFSRKRCHNPGSAQDWSTCVVLTSAPTLPPHVQLALRLRSPHYGNTIAPIDGRQFEKFALFYALTGAVMPVFDVDSDGVISAGSKDSTSNEVVQLIRTIVESVQTLDRWVTGLRQGFDAEPSAPDESKKFELPPHLNPRGFAQLITFVGSEILVRRTPEERNFFENIVSLLSNNFPKGTIHLDRLGLTALLIHVDLLPAFRKAYMAGGYFRSEPGYSPGQLQIHREDLIRHLSKLLQDHYPRTYASCVKKGYGCSCEIALDEMLPLADPGDTMIPAENLDLLSIFLWGFEGVLDNCDRNSDEKLSFKIFNGNDELDCALTNLKDVVTRLMNANVIPDHPKARFLLNFLNSVSITRAFGKAALAKGDKRFVLLNPILQFGYRHATIGSMYSLVADILNSDRLTAARKNSCQSIYH